MVGVRGRRGRPAPPPLGRSGGARVPSGCPLQTSPGSVFRIYARVSKGASETMATIHITPAGQGEHFMLLGDLTMIKAAGQGTSDRILVLENVVPPGGGPQLSLACCSMVLLFICCSFFALRAKNEQQKEGKYCC